jgi:type I restriction enzyme S subunit
LQHLHPLLPPGTVLFSSRAPIGYVAIAASALATNQGFKSLIPHVGVSSEYVYYYLKGSKNIAERFASSTTFLEVSKSRFSRIPVPLAPLGEQQRIVAKIEELFSQLDAGVAALQKAKAQLQRYRQAVLKAAVSGELTREWRQAHKDELETASLLLQRILEERRAKWEAEQLEKMKVKGKAPKDDKWKQNYREPGAPDETDLPELPDTWAWTRLDVVCDKVQDGSHFSPQVQYDESGEDRYRYITAKNIREGGLDLSGVTYVDRSFHDSIYGRCDPERGDVLLVKDGVNTGTATINELAEEFSLLSSVALLKPSRAGLDARYLRYYLSSPGGLSTITGAMTGTAIKRIILGTLKTSRIALPPLAEQQVIAEEVDRRLSLVHDVQKAVDQCLHCSERMRRSILKRAFEGGLVPQDPADEPASLLLERIMAGKASHKAPDKPRNNVRGQDTSRQMELF